MSEKSRILFVHGLGGRSDFTWGKLPALLMNDPEIAGRFEVSFYSFPAPMLRLPFSLWAPKLQDLSHGLQTHIDVLYPGEDVVLVCHSLGGVIARHYLVQMQQSGLPLQVRKAVLIATPNNGADLASVGSLILWRHHHLRQLSRGSDLLERLNADWHRLQMEKIVQVSFVVGTQDRVVDQLSATLYWGNPNVYTITGKTHTDIVKPSDESDLIVLLLKQILLGKLRARPMPTAPEIFTKPKVASTFSRDRFAVSWTFKKGAHGEIELHVDNDYIIENVGTAPTTLPVQIILDGRSAPELRYFRAGLRGSTLNSFDISKFEVRPYGDGNLATLFRSAAGIAIAPTEVWHVKNGYVMKKKRSDQEIWITNYLCRNLRLRVVVDSGLLLEGNPNFGTHGIGDVEITRYDELGATVFEASDIGAGQGFNFIWNFEKNANA
ncbi:putative alpha/beta hydrolase family esterase [Skermanella aerolata]|uniref:alpha/beta fold hydrolase n=1 Tax=Skermanella aerolata TaxID=393310 RepID=UPI003D239427